MVLEVVQIKIKPGMRDAFEAAFAKTLPLYAGAKGWKDTQLHRSVEHEDRYVLLVEWDSIKAHEVDFRESGAFAEFRALVGPFFEHPPVLEHVEHVVGS